MNNTDEEKQYRVIVHLKCSHSHAVGSHSLGDAILYIQKQYECEDIICVEGWEEDEDE